MDEKNKKQNSKTICHLFVWLDLSVLIMVIHIVFVEVFIRDKNQLLNLLYSWKQIN